MSPSNTGRGKSAFEDGSELARNTIAKMWRGKGLAEAVQRGHELRARLKELEAEASELDPEVDLDNPQQADAYTNLSSLWSTNERTVQDKFQEQSRKVQEALKEAETQREEAKDLRQYSRTLRGLHDTLRQGNNTLYQEVEDLIPSKDQRQEVEKKLQEADSRREAAEKTSMEDRKRAVALEGLVEKALKLSDDQPIPIYNAEQYDELINTVERIPDQIHEAATLKCTVKDLEGELKELELKLEEAETCIKRAADALSSRMETIKVWKTMLLTRSSNDQLQRMSVGGKASSAETGKSEITFNGV